MEKSWSGCGTIPGTKQHSRPRRDPRSRPVVGDIAAAALGAYIVWEARNLGMPKWQMARMSGKVGINWGLGLFSVIPVVGVIPTMLFRSNSKNVKIIKSISTSITRRR